MRPFLLAAIIAIVSLSGCSGSAGLGHYLIQPVDVPEDCMYVPFNGDEAREVRNQTSWSSNPGRVEIPEEWEINVTTAWLALLECDEPGWEIISMAFAFASAPEAREFAMSYGADVCESEFRDEAVLLNGVVVAHFNVDGEALYDDIEHMASRITMRTGAVDVCTMDLGDT